MKMNKKGFTLVELLAVIVILAVVMLIGVTVVGPIMSQSRIASLSNEGKGVVGAAQAAYQAEQLKGAASVIKSNSSVCFNMEWLYSKGYFKKGSNDGYKGSVLVKYNAGRYDYTYWLTNGNYYILNSTTKDYSELTKVSAGKDISTLTDTVIDYEPKVGEASFDLTNCGGAAAKDQSILYCSGTKCSVVAPTQ